MIRAHGLSKRYGDAVVLDGVSFRAAAGERIAILGVNGAGKTTLFRCLLGLVGFDGVLEVGGEPVSGEAAEIRRRIGYVPQLPPVFDLTLTGFVDLVSDIREIPTERAVAKLEELGLPLADAGPQPIRELSGGMLQKAYLALALAAEPAVLLLDEPTASLDPRSRRAFVRLLASVPRDTTVILASHRLEEIEPLADRLLVLDRGRVAFDGTLPDLWENTAMGARLRIRTGPESTTQVAGALAGLPFVRAAHPNRAGVHVEATSEFHLALEDALERLVAGAAPGARIDR